MHQRQASSPREVMPFCKKNNELFEGGFLGGIKPVEGREGCLDSQPGIQFSYFTLSPLSSSLEMGPRITPTFYIFGLFCFAI